MSTKSMIVPPAHHPRKTKFASQLARVLAKIAGRLVDRPADARFDRMLGRPRAECSPVARIDPRNITQYWWDRHTSGLSLMRADFTTHEYPPHTHEAFVVAVTETGGSVIKSRGQVEQAHASTLFVFNPGEPHSGWMGGSRRWQYRSLYLARSAIAEVAHGLGIERIPYFTRNMFRDADLISGFLALHRALEHGSDVFRERQLLIDTFGRLFCRYGSGGGRIELAPRDRALLEQAMALMQARYDHPLRLQDLASAVGLTNFQLIGLFKRPIGLT